MPLSALVKAWLLAAAHVARRCGASGATVFDPGEAYGRSRFRFTDWDGDGDLDLVLGDFVGLVHYFERQADSSLQEKSGADNPFATINVTALAMPAVTDWDGDGDLDILVGSAQGAVYLYEQSSGTLSTTPVELVSVEPGWEAAPEACDWDDDGDVDLIVGLYDGTVLYFERLTTAVLVQRDGASNPMNTIDVGRSAVPVCIPASLQTRRLADAPRDWWIYRQGRRLSTSPELLVGGYPSGAIAHYAINGSELAEVPEEDSTYAGTYIGSGWAVPDVVDLDNDGVAEMMVGTFSAQVFTTTTATETTYSETATTETTTTLPIFVGGDPATVYRGKTTNFRLRPGKLVVMFQTRDVRVLASVFAAEGNQQWFDNVKVVSEANNRSLHVRIKRAIGEFNRSTAPPGAFQTLDIGFEAGAGTGIVDAPVGRLLSRGLELSPLLVATAWRQPHLKGLPVWKQKIGRARAECVEVLAIVLIFFVCSAPASEYYGDLQHLSVRYAHLDFYFMRVHEPAFVGGLLPELWGLLAPSRMTRALLKGGPAGHAA